MSHNVSSRWFDGLIPRYYLVRMTGTSGFFLPVAILILSDKGFGLGFIGLVYAVYALAQVAVEIPTGYVGDWLGRRASLALGSVGRALVIGSYPFVGSAEAYLALHVLWAVARSFRSGTQNAWLYEILQARFDESAFARIESRGNTLKLATDAVTAIAGGLLYTVHPAIPFVATALVALAGLPLLATFPSIDALSNAGEASAEASGTLTVPAAIRLLRVQVTRPEIRWFVLYGSVFYSFFVVTRIYEQPALEAVGVPVAGFGVLYAGFKLVSAGAAATVGPLHDRLGTRQLMFALLPVYALAYMSIAVVPVLVVPVLFVNRAAYTVSEPIINQYLNDRLGDVGRATVLSGASMAFAVVGGGARLVAGHATELLGPVGFLPWVGVVLAGLGAAVWLLGSPVREPSGTRDRPAGALAAD